MASEQEELRTLVVREEDVGRRLDGCLAARIDELQVGPVSRSKLKRLIDLGAVSVNGQPVAGKAKVKAGDVIGVRFLPPEPSPLTPVAMPLSILFEDDHLIVIDKPAGLSVHPGAGASQATLVQGLLYHAVTLAAANKRDPAAAARPGIVHRLDKETTGVMVCAKSDMALASLSKQFHDKTEITREYGALVDGLMPNIEMVHSSYLHRDPKSRLRFASMSVAEFKEREAAGLTGKGPKCRFAKSAFRRDVVYGDRITLVRVRLFTGRTHQIRVHAQDLGLGILGDPTYHRPVELPKTFPADIRLKIKSLTRQMLHAKLLAFRHPKSGERMRFESPYPADFASVLWALQDFRKIAEAPNLGK